MGGEPAGREQRRVLLAEAARRGRRRRAALGLRGRASQLAIVRIDAVQGPQEDQRLHVREHAPRVHAVRRHLAEQDLVRPGGVAGGLERAPSRIHEVSVDMRAVRDRLVASRALRGDVVAVVRLVPDRPEAHARQRCGRAGRLVGPAIASADGLDEVAELGRRRLPVLAEVAGGALRRPGAGRPQRRGTVDREVDPDVVRRGVPDDRVVRRPSAGRVGGRIGGVEARRALRRERRGRNRVPRDVHPDHVHAQVTERLKGPAGLLNTCGSAWKTDVCVVEAAAERR